MGRQRIVAASACVGALVVGGLVPAGGISAASAVSASYPGATGATSAVSASYPAAARAAHPAAYPVAAGDGLANLQVEELDPVAALRAAQTTNQQETEAALDVPALSESAGGETDTVTSTVTVVKQDADGGLDVTEVASSNPAKTAKQLNAAPKTVAAPSTRRAILNAPNADGAARDLQWQLNHVLAEDAWAASTGAGVTIAVIDTGVDAAHPDLAGRVLPGYDAIRRRAGGTTDPNGHGTHVAGAIVGRGRVSGVAPDARVLPIRVMDGSGFGTTTDITAGIVWAVDNGADIINMSLGSGDPNKAEKKAIKWAHQRGVLVVAAAGNDGSKRKIYPAAYKDSKRTVPVHKDPVLGVGAVHRSGAHPSFSQRGKFVDVAAPGVRVLSTAPRDSGSYGWESGTSMAAPITAGVAAVAMSYRKDAVGAESARSRARAISAVLRSTARDLGKRGTDKRFGSGEVNAAAALTALGATVPQGMSTDARLIGGARGRAILAFTAPVGADVEVRLTSRHDGSGARGVADSSGGEFVWSGVGGGPTQLALSGLSDRMSYTATIFATIDGVESRTITGLRPVQLRVWCPRKMKLQKADKKSKLKIQAVRPTEFGIPGGAFTVTFTAGTDRVVKRIVPTSDGKAAVPVPRMRGKIRIEVAVDAADGNWPTTSGGHRTRLTT